MFAGRLFGDDFWNLLEKLEKLQSPSLVEDLGQPDAVRAAVEILKSMNVPIRLEHWADQHERVIPAPKETHITLQFSACEWLALQAHFQAFDRYRDKAIDKKLQQTLDKVRQSAPMLPLFSNLSTTTMRESMQLHDGVQEQMVQQLQRHIVHKQCLLLTLIKGEDWKLRPLKLYELEGGYCLVGEELETNCLHFIPLREIRMFEVALEDAKTAPAHSVMEVDEFVNALCALSGDRIRLILKITAPEKINFSQEGHGPLINPYMTNSNDGQLIWAATVNINSELLNWLYLHRDALTIIDPVDFHDIFEDYCRQRGIKISQSA